MSNAVHSKDLAASSSSLPSGLSEACKLTGIANTVGIATKLVEKPAKGDLLSLESKDK